MEEADVECRADTAKGVEQDVEPFTLFFLLGRHERQSWLQTMFFGISESNNGQCRASAALVLPLVLYLAVPSSQITFYTPPQTLHVLCVHSLVDVEEETESIFILGLVRDHCGKCCLVPSFKSNERSSQADISCPQQLETNAKLQFCLLGTLAMPLALGENETVMKCNILTLRLSQWDQDLQHNKSNGYYTTGPWKFTVIMFREGTRFCKTHFYFTGIGTLCAFLVALVVTLPLESSLHSGAHLSLSSLEQPGA
ncbi:hypothetical protein STEG23_020067 [Scotinomys teguina]